MPRNRRAAVTRGAITATVAIYVALAGHVFGGGDMPGPLGLIVPWVLALMVCTVFAGRRLSAVRLSVSVAVSQVLFHSLFVLGSITPATGLGHVHGLPLTLPAPTEIIGSSPMWIGHALASVATIIALHRGERMLIGLRDLGASTMNWLRRRWGVVLFTQRPQRRAQRRCIAQRPRRTPTPVPLRTVRRRGPPRHVIV